jgi:hypothetical protein
MNVSVKYVVRMFTGRSWLKNVAAAGFDISGAELSRSITGRNMVRNIT